MKKLLMVLCGVTLAIMISANAGALQFDLIKNGGFEKELGGNHFKDWTVANTSDNKPTEAGWVINGGLPPAPSYSGDYLPAINGFYDAKTLTSFLGNNHLRQSFLVPIGITSATLSWYDRIENYPLDPNTGQIDPNGDFIAGEQEFRVDILDSTDTIVQHIFSTQPGDLLIQLGPNYRYSKVQGSSFDVSDLLMRYGGEWLTLRFQEIDTIGPFNVTVDDVSLEYHTTPIPEPATILLLSTGLIGLAGYGRKR